MDKLQKHQQHRPKTPAQISKSMSPKDIYQQLGNILKNEPLSQDNKQIALLMATHGVEISEDSFGLVKKLLKGKNQLQLRKAPFY